MVINTHNPWLTNWLLYSHHCFLIVKNILIRLTSWLTIRHINRFRLKLKKQPIFGLLPLKSRQQYKIAHNCFLKWCKYTNVRVIENINKIPLSAIFSFSNFYNYTIIILRIRLNYNENIVILTLKINVKTFSLIVFVKNISLFERH